MQKEVKKKYTEIIKELDLIISKLDSSDIPIEQSIKLHEKGVELSKEAEKELNSIENNIDKYKPNKKIQVKNINIEKSFHEIENLIKKLESENIKINDAENNYKKALEIIINIESYLKKAKSKVEKYEQ